MKKIITSSLLLILSFIIYSQVDTHFNAPNPLINRDTLINTKFPSLKVQTLSKNKLELPSYTLGKPTAICLVFEQSAQVLVDTWANPILKKYSSSELNYYEIPMITSGYKWMSGFIDNGMRSGIPKALHANIATYYGNLTTYKKDLLMTNKNSCYIFLLDKEGIIKLVADSSANNIKLETLYQLIDKLK
jgi:hypothetical protein